MLYTFFVILRLRVAISIDIADGLARFEDIGDFPAGVCITDA